MHSRTIPVYLCNVSYFPYVLNTQTRRNSDKTLECVNTLGSNASSNDDHQTASSLLLLLTIIYYNWNFLIANMQVDPNNGFILIILNVSILCSLFPDEWCECFSPNFVQCVSTIQDIPVRVSMIVLDFCVILLLGLAMSFFYFLFVRLNICYLFYSFVSIPFQF